jgi:hypothetical protein
MYICGNEKRGPTINVLDMVSEGGHDDDMSTDRRDVMPGHMGGKRKSR